MDNRDELCDPPTLMSCAAAYALARRLNAAHLDRAYTVASSRYGYYINVADEKGHKLGSL